MRKFLLIFTLLFTYNVNSQSFVNTLTENKKSGTLSQNEMDSALVGPPGLEPGTNGL